MNRYNGNDIWTTYEGKEIKFKDLTDAHLANIILHLKKTGHDTDPLIKYFKKMAKKRGLSKTFLKRAQIPHVNQRGNWAMWNYNGVGIGYPEEVGGKAVVDPEHEFSWKMFGYYMWVAAMMLTAGVAFVGFIEWIK